ncbi:hypothetical protein AB0B10_24430 [Micromonospora arborensis]|uniref:hypothetical protein n=1 Tax=Micromonospora arborensis TaxID=2116518 RepID=UPI0033EE6F44
MEVWHHDGKLYEVNSYYSLPDDAWQYELAGLTGASGAAGPYVAIVIPDATPDDGPFTPRPAQHALVHLGGGQLPWPILRKLIEMVESSGDLVEEQRNAFPGGKPFPLSLNVWNHDDKQFEVNSFHLSETDSWCYELYEVKPETEDNDYIDLQIPDASPEGGPFVPSPARQVTLAMHGDWLIPWPIFRRFIDGVRASGDLVEIGREVLPTQELSD